MSDPYLTAAQVRTRQPDIADTDLFTTTNVEAYIASFQEIAEEYLGTAYTPRTAVTDTVVLDQDRYINLRWRNVTSVTSVTIAYLGNSQTIASTSYLLDKRGGAIDLLTPYTGEATVVYAHGLATANIPATLLDICSEYVRARALRSTSGMGRDVIRQGPEGAATYSTPDLHANRPTGYILVDAGLNNLRRRAPGVG